MPAVLALLSRGPYLISGDLLSEESETEVALHCVGKPAG